MNDCYNQILNNFKSEKDIIKAIVSNNALIYYYMSQMVIENSNTYRNLEIRKGKETANRVLTDSLIVFRRQVKYEKVKLNISGEKVFVNKNSLDLSEYLIKLFILIYETDPVNPNYKRSLEFEEKLIKGRGFQNLYEFKVPVMSSLHNYGCKLQQDKEEIFNESLVVFWEKLINKEIGIYSNEKINSPDNYRVYNRKFYQNSKLNTFITGIALNLFRNRTRASGYNKFVDEPPEITDRGNSGQVFDKSDNPALLMFLYYRNFIETRKLRTVISLLQYDCNLEDKEVRQIIGINNARIHSSRLRSRFYEWYELNKNKFNELTDEAGDYFFQRESKKEKLNEKIRTVDLYERYDIDHIDLNIYKEEFRTLKEFTDHHRTFKHIFYFTSTGKTSALTGLPDEKPLKDLMASYKNELFKLPRYQCIALLLFYGSDETKENMINLLKDLDSELTGTGRDAGATNGLSQKLGEHVPQNIAELENELYNTNHTFYNNFSID